MIILFFLFFTSLMYCTIPNKRATIQKLIGIEAENALYLRLIEKVPNGDCLSIFDKLFEKEYLDKAFQSTFQDAKKIEDRLVNELEIQNVKLDSQVPLVLDSGDIKCAKCAKNGQIATNMISSQHQIRSADEAMTIIWRCLTCNHQFAIN